MTVAFADGVHNNAPVVQPCPYVRLHGFHYFSIGAASKPSRRSFRYNPRRVRPRVRAASEMLPLLRWSVASMISLSSPSTAEASDVTGPPNVGRAASDTCLIAT